MAEVMVCSICSELLHPPYVYELRPTVNRRPEKLCSPECLRQWADDEAERVMRERQKRAKEHGW